MDSYERAFNEEFIRAERSQEHIRTLEDIIAEKDKRIKELEAQIGELKRENSQHTITLVRRNWYWR